MSYINHGSFLVWAYQVYIGLCSSGLGTAHSSSAGPTEPYRDSIQETTTMTKRRLEE